MRNLKKLLALVLAMVMAFSLMLSASAVDFSEYPDKDSITAEFTEGVQVLTGLKVFQGDEKGFRPSDKITRAEASAIIYRMATGDVDNRQNDLYKDYSTFVDVNSDDWFAGYVGYCQNAGYIKGTSPTTFNPYGQVTGYEVLAMILRVVGYGKNNEFTGASWQVNVAALSRELGVTKNVTAAHMEQTLNMAAPREVVADLVFMTSTIVPTVTYTPALAYNDKNGVLGSTSYNETLGQKTFGLWYETSWTESDDWGRPGYSWYKNGARVGQTNAETGKAYMIKENHPLYRDPNNTSSKIATIMAVPDYETKEQVRECDVAHDLEITNAQNFDLYVNSKNVTAEDYRIVATDTVTKVGGQGRVTEFYYGISSPWFADSNDDYAVMIDTMLAQITGKRDVKLDKNNHVIVPAQLDVVIYDGDKKTPNTPNSSTRIISKPGNSKDNWEYAVGDFILINAYTNQDDNTTNDHAAGNTNSKDLEWAAFETNKVVAPRNNILVQGTHVWVLKTPDVKQAKQTVTYWNQGKHNVDGTDIPDQMTLFLDVAGSTTNTTYNWYFDQYGNIIGIGPAKGSNYGVITSIYAANNQGENSTVGTTKAIATVRYADGTTGTVQIDRFLMSSDVDDISNGKNATAGTALTAAANTVDLRPVYNVDGTSPMAAKNPITAFIPVGAKNDGSVYISTDASRNKDGHFQNTTSGNGDAADTTDNYHILWDNLFMFTTANDDAVVAVEVAGAANNLNSWINLRNAMTNAGNGGMIYKNASFLTLNDGVTGDGVGTNGNVGPANVYLDNDTKIMVRTGTTIHTSSISTYDGVDALPSNVVLAMNSEVDWADTDGDGRADYLYVTGSVTGVVTYGLFYYNAYNGDVARWDGTANSGTISGYLNGEAYTATFKNRSLFDAVNNTANYNGHLFALQFNGDVVTGVMPETDRNSVQILNNGSNGTGTSLNIANKVNGFVTGTAGGNNYTATTEAVYFEDGNDSELTYRYDNYASGGRTIVVTGTGAGTYWLTPNCTIVGELEWLNTRSGNDVTMVYEQNATNGQNAVSAIYITPDPDVTPSNPDAIYSIDAPNLTMQLTATTLSFTNYGTYKVNGTAYSGAAIASGTVSATFKAENNVGEWVTVGSYSNNTGVSCNTAGAMTLPDITVTSLAQNVTYRVTVTVELAGHTMTVCENIPIGRV